MTFEYIPVVADWPVEAASDPYGFDRAWYRDSSYYRYKWFLTSPMTSWKKRAREQYQATVDTQIFHDSGGFMLVKGNFPGSPRQSISTIASPVVGGISTAMEVADWYNQSARKVGGVRDPCMILDAPVVRAGEPRELDDTGDADSDYGAFQGLVEATDEEFERALVKTCKNAEVMLERRKGDYDLFGVIHATRPAQFDTWFRRLDRVGEFDGFAIPPKANPMLMAMGLVLAHHYFPKKPVHFLGQGGSRAFVSCAYFSRFVSGRVTVDSSTATRYARRTVYILPGQLKGIQLLTKWPKGTPREGQPYPLLPEVPCDCPVCKWNGPEAFRGGEGKSLVGLLNAHNLHQIVRYAKEVEAAAGNRALLLTLGPSEQVRAILDIFDSYRERGYEAILQNEGTLRLGYDRGQRTMKDWGEPEPRCDLCLIVGKEAHHPWDAGVDQDGKPVKMNLCDECWEKSKKLEGVR